MKEAYSKYYSRYYSKPFQEINIEVIKQITRYSLNQIDPQVTKEAVEVIQAITTAVTGEDVLRYVLNKKDINPELEHFLISIITNAYN